MATAIGISLPLLAFRHRLKRTTDATWHALCSQEYAQRWWDTIPKAEQPSDISQYEGDRRFPFGAIKITPEQFLKKGESFSGVHIENSIVSIAAVFEAYLADLISRCVHIKPDLLANSELQISIGELVSPAVLQSPITWLSQTYVQKTIRNNSHSKLIKKLGKMFERNIEAADTDSFKVWQNYIILRNTLVHAAGLTTPELTAAWPEKFQTVRTPIELDPSDVIAAHKAAYSLANTIDKFAIETVINNSDADLFVREIFVSKGIDDVSILSQMVWSILNTQFDKTEVDRALAKQRKTQDDPRNEFFLREEWIRQPHSDTQKSSQPTK